MNRPQQGFPPILDHRGAPHVRRFDEQRWLIDNIIRANGIDWDQPRSLYIHAPCGIEANADFAGIRERVKKMADIGPAFAAVARRREAKANAAAQADHKVTARDNFFMAAVHWGAAQWPYDENDETNIAYNNKKRECYAKYAALADHHVEAVWVPFKDKAIPAWLHLPPNYTGGRLPVVIAIPGMDSYKEIQVALYGDKFLNRGMAVLAIDGPGQYEAPMIGLYFTMENWIAAGPALVDWIAARPELDATRIGVVRHELRLAVRHRAHRQRAAHQGLRGDVGVPRARLPHDFPGSLADLQEALHVHVGHHRRGRIRRIPQNDHLGGPRRENPRALSLRRRRGRGAEPARTFRAADGGAARGRSRWWSIRNRGIRSATFRPPISARSRRSCVADWLADRLAGKPFVSERWYVTGSGEINKTAY